jgi:AbrB family transcriptional regulator (stage V sporulation protein T)
MGPYTTRMEKSGRVLVPAEVRRKLGLHEGATVILKVDDAGGLGLKSRMQVLEEVRRDLRRFIPPGSDLAGELIRDRRAEAAREETELGGR